MWKRAVSLRLCFHDDAHCDTKIVVLVPFLPFGLVLGRFWITHKNVKMTLTKGLGGNGKDMPPSQDSPGFMKENERKKQGSERLMPKKGRREFMYETDLA